MLSADEGTQSPENVVEQQPTSKREGQTRPMKLLLWAILTASFTDIEACPLLSTVEL